MLPSFQLLCRINRTLNLPSNRRDLLSTNLATITRDVSYFHVFTFITDCTKLFFILWNKSADNLDLFSTLCANDSHLCSFTSKEHLFGQGRPVRGAPQETASSAVCLRRQTRHFGPGPTLHASFVTKWGVREKSVSLYDDKLK